MNKEKNENHINQMSSINRYYMYKKKNELEQPGHYYSGSYNTKERFASYWHQINEILSLKPKKVLEIGIGNGFVAKYLTDRQVNIVSLDIDKRLNPTVNGNVLQLPFFDKVFDVVACYEVLEHLPYDNFEHSLREMARVSNQYIILSIPDVSKVYRFYFEMPRIGLIKGTLPHPFRKKISYRSDSSHHWEIGNPGFSLEKIRFDIKSAGLTICDTFRIFEAIYHRFILLKKAH
jgi:ubiquinone/menaquinone biosynthesis C-methylase UbiE